MTTKDRSGQNNTPQVQQPSAAHMEDWNLVQDCIGGDRRCWATLIERYEPAIGLAISHTLRAHHVRHDPALLEDLQSDVFVALVRDDCRKLRRYSGRCRLGSWLKVVASHLTIDALRRRRPSISLNDDGNDVAASINASLRCPQESAEETLGRRDRLEALRALYDALPKEDRRFVTLFFEREMSFEQVAAEMKTTVAAVYARKNRVRKKLLALARARGLD